MADTININGHATDAIPDEVSEYMSTMDGDMHGALVGMRPRRSDTLDEMCVLPACSRREASPLTW
jgi:hypothetical protein